MRHLESQIIINAPIDKVWRALTDLASYKNWSSTIEFGKCVLKEDADAEVTVHFNGIRRRKTATILSVKPHQLFSWEYGHSLFRLITKTWMLQSEGLHQTKLIHREEHSGMLSALLSEEKLGRHLPDLDLFHQELKRYIEIVIGR
jgi:uncharacterized protein YndB with AHSA1/START domain